MTFTPEEFEKFKVELNKLLELHASAQKDYFSVDESDKAIDDFNAEHVRFLICWGVSI